MKNARMLFESNLLGFTGLCMIVGPLYRKQNKFLEYKRVEVFQIRNGQFRSIVGKIFPCA